MEVKLTPKRIEDITTQIQVEVAVESTEADDEPAVDMDDFVDNGLLEEDDPVGFLH